jgi:serine/threonine protein kinase
MSDLWAIGCILYMMVIGRPPFEGSSVKTTVDNIKNGNFKLPSSLSPDCKDLILRLLTYNPKMRITIDQVLDHPFLNGTAANSDL